MKHFNFFAALAFAALILTFLLIPTLMIGQTGSTWFGNPGQIGADCQNGQLRMWTESEPTKANYLSECVYLYGNGEILPADCLAKDTVSVDFPAGFDSVEVFKQVTWQTVHGARIAWTARKTVYKCGNNYSAIEYAHQEDYNNGTAYIKTNMKGVVIEWNVYGVVSTTDFDPYQFEYQLIDETNFVDVLYQNGETAQIK